VAGSGAPGAPLIGRSGGGAPLIGVLALQGDFAAHTAVLERLGALVREVRVPADLDGLDGLVMPGGESTTMSLGIEREGLAGPLRELVQGGRPVLGTCAGLIMLDRRHLGVMDVLARRNAFGRQAQSFEAEVAFAPFNGRPLRAVFIRAPWIEEHGPGVEVLAEVDGQAVAAREGSVVVVAFHPELSGDDRIHRWFLEEVVGARPGRGRPA